MLEWTGERYLPYIDPSISGAEIHYEHLHRYAFASQYVKGKKVLDLASGEGYGTFILSKNADYVIGVEIDGSAVTHASKTYKKENIEFRKGSILKIPIEGEKKFDVIVCFEAMEHVKEHDTLFVEIKRLLKNDGILIISTPNKQTYTDDTGYHNPFHQKELYYAEFSDFLKKYFSYIYLFGQRVFSGSTISPTSVNAPNSCSEFFIEQDKNHFTFTRDDEKISKYFIAIASNTKLNQKKIQKCYLIDKSNAEIAHLRTRVNQYNALIQSLEQAVAGKDRQILDMTATVQSLEQAVADKDQQMQEIINQFQLLRDESDSIKKSITYRLVAKFHRCVIERLLPHNTRRRNNYDLGIKGGRILVNEGWHNFYWQFKEKIFPKPIARKKIHFPQITITPVQKPVAMSTIDTCVSIIIPTKNAGSDFERVLEKLICQKGIKEIEIIIIDSGSCDSTLTIARKFGSRIYEINPGDFNHGTTRNFGAEKARGRYICFLVQDAIPVGNYWIHSMVDVLEKDQTIAAATCRQIPRSDADLFACFGLWQHYFYTLDAGSDRICHTDVDFDTLQGEEKRRLAGLDDVSCLIRKDIFDKYRFKRIQASEDLDLGKRLIQDGYKNAFLFSVGVIHSHNRDPGYFLRRSYVDTKTVADIVGYQTQEISKGCTLSEILGSIITLYNSLNLAIDTIEHTSTDLSTRKVTKKILSDLSHNYEKELGKKPEIENTGRCLDDAIHAIIGHLNGQPDNSNMAQNTLIFNQYEWILNNFFEYIDVYDTMDDKKRQFQESFYKIFAVVAGASVASYYLHKALTSDLDNEISSIDAELSAGV